MPVRADSIRSGYIRQEGQVFPHRDASVALPGHSSEWITIGLINNMREAAFNATERQFVFLLEAASEGLEVRLLRYVFPEISRTEASAHHARNYSSIESLFDTHLDGLIVTGREPATSDLRDECYWESFTKVIEWAQCNTHSAVWSCLAAHAAVLHMDGIDRRKSVNKHFGVFDCRRLSDHPLTTGAPSLFPVPHSRWNGVAEEELLACGYSVLARAEDAGVDTFVKEGKSLFVFFQGHPEYESDTLMREYRRDIERYLRFESNTYPKVPRRYFDPSTEEALAALREKARSCPDGEIMASVASALSDRSIHNTWHLSAARVYRNWLNYLYARRDASRRDSLAILA
jgi:homoserine O-succinyltransferase